MFFFIASLILLFLIFNSLRIGQTCPSVHVQSSPHPIRVDVVYRPCPTPERHVSISLPVVVLSSLIPVQCRYSTCPDHYRYYVWNVLEYCCLILIRVQQVWFHSRPCPVLVELLLPVAGINTLLFHPLLDATSVQGQNISNACQHLGVTMQAPHGHSIISNT